MKKSKRLIFTLISSLVFSSVYCPFTAHAEEQPLVSPSYDLYDSDYYYTPSDGENPASYTFEMNTYDPGTAYEETFSDDGEHTYYEYTGPTVTGSTFNVSNGIVTVTEHYSDGSSHTTTWSYDTSQYSDTDILDDIANYHYNGLNKGPYQPEVNMNLENTDRDNFNSYDEELYQNDEYLEKHTEYYNTDVPVSNEENSSSYGPSNYNPSSFEIVTPYGPDDYDGSTTFVNPDADQGNYNGINWSYNPVEKKLTFTPGTSTIIPWIAQDKYTSLPWMKYKDQVEKISVQDGITSVYANNFRDFTNLNKVYMSKDVTQISSYAFTGDNNIKTFIINCEYLDMEFDPAFYSNLTDNATITCNYSNKSGSTYDTAISSSKTVITNQMADGNLNNVERINQVTPRIQEVWGMSACVISSYEMLIERTAANEGYMSLSGNYSLTTGEDILLKDSNDPTLVDENQLFKWPTENRTCKTFVKETSDGKYIPLTVNLKCDRSELTEDKLIKLLNEHPEGILVYQQYSQDGTSHAVVVTGYSTSVDGNTFFIMDPGSRSNVTNKYISICGHVSINTKLFYYVDEVVN